VTVENGWPLIGDRQRLSDRMRSSTAWRELRTGHVEDKAVFVGAHGRHDPVGTGGNRWVARSASI
jgi:hypothetical protein